MSRAIDGLSLLQALNDAGFTLPVETRSVELHMAVGEAAFVRLDVLLTDADLLTVSRALAALAKDPER